jgi:hypothetical protein
MVKELQSLGLLVLLLLLRIPLLLAGVYRHFGAFTPELADSSL